MGSTSCLRIAQYDLAVPPPPPQLTPISALEDAHARMDRLEQRMRQMRVSDGAISWDDFDKIPMACLPAQFRILEIERYTGIGYPKIHLRLYNSVMRAHGLDEVHLIMLFPMSLSGVAQCSIWYRGRHARGLWPESSLYDSKGKKPSGGQRLGDVGTISST
ncbi:hypothetical protein AAG906_010484 [Vitis piasezkii]